MKYSDFETISAEIIQKYYNDLKIIDDKNFGGKSIHLQTYKLNLIYFFYEMKRKEIRKLYMSQERKPMDRHKIASNIMCAILKSKIVFVNRLIPNLPNKIIMANEYIAFYTAINILELYKIEAGFDNYKIIFPETYIEEEKEDSYIENVCKALYYTKHFGIGEIFSYANILFLLEKNTENEEKLSSFNLKVDLS